MDDCTYCLVSESDPEKTYVGKTSHFKRRLKEHNTSKKRCYTKAHRPWKPLFKVFNPYMSQLEHAWKKQRRGRCGGVRGRVVTLQYLMTIRQWTKSGGRIDLSKVVVHSTLSQREVDRLCSDKYPLLKIEKWKGPK